MPRNTLCVNAPLVPITYLWFCGERKTQQQLSGPSNRFKGTRHRFKTHSQKGNLSESIINWAKYHNNQCDQIERFLKGLITKCSFKSSPNIWWHFGLFGKHLLGQLLENFELIFIHTSCPTDYGKSIWPLLFLYF